MICGRGNADNAILDQLRQIAARLDATETTQRRRAHLDNVSDDEVVAPNHNPKPKEYQDEARLLRVLCRENSKPSIQVVPYDGKLDTNAMLDWILDIEKFFKYEKIPDNRKVKIAATRLKGHASLWWEHWKIDRQRRRSRLGQKW